MKMMAIILLGACVTNLGRGQTELDQNTTDGFLNGRFWNSFVTESGQNMKGMYISGIIEADAWNSIILADVAANGGKASGPVSSNLTPLSLNRLETVAILDAFYKEPLNLRIPVVKALVIATLKTNGTDPEKVAGVLSIFDLPHFPLPVKTWKTQVYTTVP